jgi:hypothetical protein
LCPRIVNCIKKCVNLNPWNSAIFWLNEGRRTRCSLLNYLRYLQRLIKSDILRVNLHTFALPIQDLWTSIKRQKVGLFNTYLGLHACSNIMNGLLLNSELYELLYYWFVYFKAYVWKDLWLSSNIIELTIRFWFTFVLFNTVYD